MRWRWQLGMGMRRCVAWAHGYIFQLLQEKGMQLPCNRGEGCKERQRRLWP